MHDDHTDFDAWAADLYAKDRPVREFLGALCLVAFLAVVVALSPLVWITRRINRLYSR